MFAMEAKASGGATDRSGGQVFKAGAVPTSIKRVKPAYVQSLRPESSSVSDDDIRLSYAKLLFNAFNGLEKKDLSQKFRALCVDDPSMSVKWIGDKGNSIWSMSETNMTSLNFHSLCSFPNIGNPCGPDYREASGLIPVTSWLEAIMVTAVPDAVIQLQDSKLRVRPDKSSYLLCKYTFNGTQISKIESVGTAAQPSNNNNTSLINMTSVSLSKAEENEAKNSLADVVERSVNRSDSITSNASASKGRKRPLETASAVDIVDHSPLEATTFLQTSFKMSIVGTLIIHINPEKRIHKFEYIQKLIKLTVGTQ